MVSFNTTRLSSLTNDVFRTLFVRIHQETEGLAENKRKKAFDEAWKAFEQAMDDSTKWRRSLKDYDSICDKAWLLLMAQVEASKLHFDAKRAEAGAKLSAIIGDIGNITYLPFEKEYALMRKALNQIMELDEAVLKDAHVDDIVIYLSETYDNFMAAQQKENELRAEYQTGTVKNARIALFESWEKYAAYLEILADDDENICTIIGRINQCIIESSK